MTTKAERQADSRNSMERLAAEQRARDQLAADDWYALDCDLCRLETERHPDTFEGRLVSVMRRLYDRLGAP